MKSDLERAFDALKAKAEPYSKLFAYLDGDHPTMYTTRRLRELFRGVDAVFTENWCEVVVRSALNRLHLEKLAASDEGTDRLLGEVWDDNLGDLLSADLHESALVTGEGFIIAWVDETAGLQIAHNDPRLCHVFYQAAAPTEKRFAAKWWVEEDETLRLVLYYPERLEYYATRQKAQDVTQVTAFQEWQPPAPNPWGIIPVFHFRRSRRRAIGELHNVIPLQNGINKLAADMMVAAEYGAFKQRWIISQIDPGGQLRNAPNEIWSLPAGDEGGQPTQVGEFSATDLANYLSAIENLANTISTISATPKHFFFQSGGVPSGEALMTEEAPLVAKVLSYQRAFTPEWQALGAFLVQLLTGSAPPVRSIIAQYTTPSAVQPRTAAEITQIRVASGIPLPAALRLEGFSEDEVAEIIREREEEERRRQATLGQALLAAQRRTDALKTIEDE